MVVTIMNYQKSKMAMYKSQVSSTMMENIQYCRQCNRCQATRADAGSTGSRCDERRSGDSYLSKSSTKTWLSNAPTARQARIENIIEGQPGPT